MNQGNAMINAILHFQEGGAHENNWTRALCRGLAFSNFDEEYYFSSQSMEPSLLFEVARETGHSREALESLDYSSDGPMAAVQWLVKQLHHAPHIQRLNLAYCLSSAARYQLAAQVLAQVDPARLLPDQRFLYQMARFMVANREDFTVSSEAEFAAIRGLIEDNVVSPRRVLLASSFAIVWSSKTKAISEGLQRWFVERGHQVATALESGANFADQISLSGFYRAYAMIPADRRDVAQTRAMMEKASHFAEIAVPKSKVSECAALDARKTILESSLKEYLYVAKRLDEAERVGRALIELDPEWSISYHELAEVMLHQERFAEALELFERARAIGLPRVTYSQYMIGQCLEALGRDEEALAAFESTLSLDDTNISAGISGHNLAKRLEHASLRTFDRFVSLWGEGGLLLPEHKELLL